MNTFAVLNAAAVAVALTGLVLLVMGIYGRAPAETPFGRKIRTSGALLAARQRSTKGTIALIVGAAAWLFTGLPVVGIAAATAVFAIPYFFGDAAIIKARTARLEALEEWARRIADTVAAGQAIIQAIVRSAAHVGEPIHREVQQLANALGTPRLDPRIALRRFAHDIDDALGDTIALALEIAVTSHGAAQIPSVLQAMAESVADEVKGRRAIETGRAGARREARLILLVVGAVMAVVLIFTDYADGYGTLVGELVLAVICLLIGASLWMMRRFSIGNLPPRILDAPQEERR